MVENKSNAKVVKNASSGYGYKYSSLADLAEAGIDIPKMRVKPTEFGEFIEYLDKDGNWQIGAKIVEFEAKGMNHAQMYGAALTYARRYTVHMAEHVACDDDKGVESSKPANGAQKRSSGFTAGPTEKQIGFLAKLYRDGGMSEADIKKYTEVAKTKSAKEVSQTIENAKARLAQRKAETDEIPTDEEVEAFDE